MDNRTLIRQGGSSGHRPTYISAAASPRASTSKLAVTPNTRVSGTSGNELAIPSSVRAPPSSLRKSISSGKLSQSIRNAQILGCSAYEQFDEVEWLVDLTSRIESALQNGSLSHHHSPSARPSSPSSARKQRLSRPSREFQELQQRIKRRKAEHHDSSATGGDVFGSTPLPAGSNAESKASAEIPRFESEKPRLSAQEWVVKVQAEFERKQAQKAAVASINQIQQEAVEEEEDDDDVVVDPAVQRAQMAAQSIRELFAGGGLEPENGETVDLSQLLESAEALPMAQPSAPSSLFETFKNQDGTMDLDGILQYRAQLTEQQQSMGQDVGARSLKMPIQPASDQEATKGPLIQLVSSDDSEADSSDSEEKEAIHVTINEEEEDSSDESSSDEDEDIQVESIEDDDDEEEEEEEEEQAGVTQVELVDGMLRIINEHNATNPPSHSLYDDDDDVYVAEQGSGTPYEMGFVHDEEKQEDENELEDSESDEDMELGSGYGLRKLSDGPGADADKPIVLSDSDDDEPGSHAAPDVRRSLDEHDGVGGQDVRAEEESRAEDAVPQPREESAEISLEHSANNAPVFDPIHDIDSEDEVEGEDLDEDGLDEAVDESPAWAAADADADALIASSHSMDPRALFSSSLATDVPRMPAFSSFVPASQLLHNGMNGDARSQPIRGFQSASAIDPAISEAFSQPVLVVEESAAPARGDGSAATIDPQLDETVEAPVADAAPAPVEEGLETGSPAKEEQETDPPVAESQPSPDEEHAPLAEHVTEYEPEANDAAAAPVEEGELDAVERTSSVPESSNIKVSAPDAERVTDLASINQNLLDSIFGGENDAASTLAAPVAPPTITEALQETPVTPIFPASRPLCQAQVGSSPSSTVSSMSALRHKLHQHHHHHHGGRSRPSVSSPVKFGTPATPFATLRAAESSSKPEEAATTDQTMLTVPSGVAGITAEEEDDEDMHESRGPSTRSQCTFHKLKFLSVEGSPVFLVPQCAIQHDVAKREGARDLGELPEEEEFDNWRQLDPDRLPADLHHRFARITGLQMISDAMTPTGSPYTMQEEQTEPLDAMEEDEDQQPTKAKIEQENASMPDDHAVANVDPDTTPVTPNRSQGHQRTESGGSIGTRSSRRRHKRSDATGPEANFVPVEERRARSRTRTAEGKGDLSISILEDTEEDEEKDLNAAEQILTSLKAEEGKPAPATKKRGRPKKNEAASKPNKDQGNFDAPGEEADAAKANAKLEETGSDAQPPKRKGGRRSRGAKDAAFKANDEQDEDEEGSIAIGMQRRKCHQEEKDMDGLKEQDQAEDEKTRDQTTSPKRAKKGAGTAAKHGGKAVTRRSSRRNSRSGK